jgi:hypothetical protein
MDTNGAFSGGLPIPIACPFIGCPCTFERGTKSEETHFRWHKAEIRAHWRGESRCTWPNCLSKAIFKSPGQLKTHLFNIHATPLVCAEPKCTYEKPFRNQHDLRRHAATAHGETGSHKCPIEDCDASTEGFARKDKLLKHIRQEHENVRCTYNHCSAVVLATQTASHLSQYHGDLECRLGGCRNSPASKFTKLTLTRHLRRDHSISFDGTRTWTNFSGSITETDDMRYYLEGYPAKDCKICLKQNNESVPRNDGKGIYIGLEQGTL